MSDPILITGAARRVGLYLAEQLLDAGHPVIAHYRTMTAELEALVARGVTAFQAELDKEEDVLALVEQVRAHTPTLRAIIHNASSYEPTIRNSRDALRQYRLFFGVHMMAPYILNEELRGLLEASSGFADIIHITDIYAERPNPQYDIYCSTKAGLANLNKSFAKRFAPRIQVNAIAPGPILFLNSHSEEERKRILGITPLQVEGGPQAIYMAVRSLLDHHYTTGITIPVDGGRSLAE